MDFDHSPKVQALQKKLTEFMESHVYPNEQRYKDEVNAGDRWQPPALMEELKKKARAEELWNLFLPESKHGAGLTNLEYAPLCEIMGRVRWAPEVFNCSAPDTGNMEMLERYGTEEQKKRMARAAAGGQDPLLLRHDRAARRLLGRHQHRVPHRAATATDYVINGRKWWSSGAPDPRCKLFIFMGKTDPDNPDRHKQQSMILVPRDARA